MTETPPTRHLLTFASGGWVLLLSALLCLLAAFLILRPAFQTGFRPAIGDGQHIDSYGFDLSHLTLPRDTLIASGQPKDGIRAIPAALIETIRPAEADLIAKNEHIRFLVPSDRIIGLELGGEPRAYPLRILALHEVVNDTLSGTPLCITYSPLCDSVVVFDRRIDGPNDPPLEFGHSGLLINSNLVLYDRRPNPAQESLWSQLALAAISGPKAGTAMKLIPYQLTTWSAWRAAHASTRVFIGLRTLKAEYGAEPYNTYFSDDQLRFPVAPLWTARKIRLKTPILATSEDALHWTARLAPTPDSGTLVPSPNPYRIHSFLFAWYAFHPQDTDWSEMLVPRAPN